MIRTILWLSVILVGDASAKVLRRSIKMSEIKKEHYAVLAKTSVFKETSLSLEVRQTKDASMREMNYDFDVLVFDTKAYEKGLKN